MNSIRPLRLLSVSLFAFAVTLVALSMSGCSTFSGMSDPDVQALFDHAITRIQERVASDPAPTTPDTSADAVDYSTFQWVYGGFNGANAVLDDKARINSLRFDANNLYYSWLAGTGCEDLGATSAGDSGATLACLFLKTSTGQWVGGKFDWISTSRTSRGLSHCYNYNGWTLADIPNPCDAAFVIVSVKTGTRSNVITSTWRR